MQYSQTKFIRQKLTGKNMHAHLITPPKIPTNQEKTK
jgi:hypothetical protein